MNMCQQLKSQKYWVPLNFFYSKLFWGSGLFDRIVKKSHLYADGARAWPGLPWPKLSRLTKAATVQEHDVPSKRAQFNLDKENAAKRLDAHFLASQIKHSGTI